MKTNRRNFLKTSGFSALGLIASINLPKQVFGASQEFALQTSDSFRNLIGTNFTLYQTDSAIESVLLDVKTFTPKKSNQLKQTSTVRTVKTNSFRLVFAVSDNNLEQKFYQVFHPSIGLFNLLLVPGMTENNQPTLSAVINRFS